MKAIRLISWTLLTVILATVLQSGPSTALPAAAAEPGGGQESISGSYVYLNSIISPDDCYQSGQSQTFCFQAISYTTDNDYVYNVWHRFPDDWIVQNITVFDTPYCINGGTFGAFSWAALTPNEVRIDQNRYQGNPSDTCTAYYCFDVISGTHSPGGSYAKVSWYWVSSMWGSPPFFPCSSDGYTPPGQAACDEMITAPAFIFPCSGQLYYLPAVFKRWP